MPFYFSIWSEIDPLTRQAGQSPLARARNPPPFPLQGLPNATPLQKPLQGPSGARGAYRHGLIPSALFWSLVGASPLQLFRSHNHSPLPRSHRPVPVLGSRDWGGSTALRAAPPPPAGGLRRLGPAAGLPAAPIGSAAAAERAGGRPPLTGERISDPMTPAQRGHRLA